MNRRVGTKGQVVIPKQLRDALGIEAGDEVTFTLDQDGIRIAPHGSGAAFRGAFRGHDLLGILAAERRAERERDARRF